MIDQKKLPRALKAIQGIIIQARFMTQQNEDSQRIAALLDSAEYLPGLLIDKDDKTSEFSEFLAGIGEQFPNCRYIIDEFSQSHE